MNNFNNLFAFFMFAVALSFTACEPTTTLTTITGTVTDGTSSIAGVSVTTSNGGSSTTDASGNYSIDADPSGTITFTLKGFITQEKNVSNQTTINVTLILDPWPASFGTNNNSSIDPVFTSNTLSPTADVTATSPTGSWYSSAAYKGAVDPAGTPWYDDNNWSFFSRIVAGQTTSAPLNISSLPTKQINDSWMLSAGTTVNWSKDTVYLLDGFVFVGAGQTLNISAGTVIQGKAGTGANASALIVSRDGMINAIGTAAEPIIFTYDGDNGGTNATVRGQWGGLIILGNAGLNSTPGETQIEGIPTTETRGLYGNTSPNNTDNSGTLQYVSIRHGGTNIGNDNEINGLTLGGVGSETTLEHIEIIANQDDGIEWFGGTADAKWLIAAYCGDDALDYDEGYRGRNQFVIIHQEPGLTAEADRGGEHDGGTSPETATPYATPKFWNVTSTGNQTSKAITFRDNAGGQYHNSIFIGYGKGIDIEDIPMQDQDSYKQYTDGNLSIENCIFHNIGAGTTGVDLFTISN